MRCSLMIQLFCWNIFHTIFKIKIKTFSLANWALSLSKSLRHEAHTKTFFLNAKPTWKVPQSFPIRIDCWKKCSSDLGEMESFSSNWQDYNFNQKTSSTWPKFSIGYSPYAVIPRKFFDFGKMFCFLWPLLGISTKIIAKIVNEEATGNSFRAQFRRDHQCWDRFLNRPKVEQFLSLKEDPPYHDLP